MTVPTSEVDSPWLRPATAVCWTALALTAAAILALIWTRDIPHLLQSFTHDDAFYYLETARRAAAGQGLTFDGRNPTNGFHPLWTGLLVGFFRLFRGSGEAAFRWILSLQVGLLFVPSAVLLFRAVRQAAGPALGLTALALVLLLFPERQVNAMESGVLLLAGVIVVAGVLTRGWLDAGASPARRFEAGLALGALFLARTDSILLILPFGLMALLLDWVAARRAGPVRLGALLRGSVPLVLGTALVAAPYLIWDVTVHGHLMPISGALKNSLPQLALTTRYVDRSAWLMVLLVLPGLLYAGTRPSRSGLAPDRLNRATMLLGAYVMLHLAFTMLTMRWAVFPWHFYLYPLGAVLSVLVLARALWGRAAGLLRSGLVPAGIAALALLGGAANLYLYRDRPIRVFFAGAYAAALWARGHLPAAARIAMKDAGVFGYFSDRSVTNLDGVINNYEYQEYLGRGDVAGYLRDQGIGYVAQHALWEYPDVNRGTYQTFEFPIRSQLYRRAGGTLLLRHEDEQYREGSVDSGRPTAFVIWRYRP
jgi:hypothetical protein